LGEVVLNYWVAKVVKIFEMQTFFAKYFNIFDQSFYQLKYVFSPGYERWSNFYPRIFDRWLSDANQPWHEGLRKTFFRRVFYRFRHLLTTAWRDDRKGG